MTSIICCFLFFYPDYLAIVFWNRLLSFIHYLENHCTEFKGSIHPSVNQITKLGNNIVIKQIALESHLSF